MLASCRTQPNSPSDETGGVQAVGQTDTMTVNFISKGSGIDDDAVEKLNTLITEFESDNSVSLVYEKRSKGKEGEVTYTFDLSSLKSGLKDEFISKIQLLASNSQNVIVKFE